MKTLRTFLQQIERIIMGLAMLIIIIVLGGGAYLFLLLIYHLLLPIFWEFQNKIALIIGLLAAFWILGRLREYFLRNEPEEKLS